MKQIMHAVEVEDLHPKNVERFHTLYQFYGLHPYMPYMLEADDDDKGVKVPTERLLLFEMSEVLDWAPVRFPAFPFRPKPFFGSPTNTKSNDQESDLKERLDAKQALAQLLDQCRQDCGWTMAALAERLHLDESAVKRHLSGRVAPRLANLKNYVDLFNQELNLTPPLTVASLRELASGPKGPPESPETPPKRS